MLGLAKENASKLLFSKTIAPIIQKIYSLSKKLPQDQMSYTCKEGIRIDLSVLNSVETCAFIREIALDLKPWRKGPFYLGDLFIDAEWKSYIKWNLLTPFVDLKDKDVADIGCNNGYYLFEMAKFSPKTLVGFDPSGLYKTQFDFINLFLKQNIVYELLGIEHLRIYDKKFDVIFCLGVLYHRSDPIFALKSLFMGLKEGGELILDTLIIDSELEIALCPKKSYAKMPNVYFIPSIPTLRGWCERAGFTQMEILTISETSVNEQRKTEWIEGLSLESFLDPKDPKRTIEGYNAPKRGYFRLKRMKNG
ncbi:tRNA 5-methoxyuridine(34)/uridine 5-oxyacetic acid(34) synthase CmoB [Helicobacter sp. 12S02232-10]|uniref:tRNA 5-methoxyuridine(34)/uridine 5-oxyacetic acid(34) synthase CmoB n=1 Tax=Helicobacter sp. 12S02232-10 TaxID=1476197 RepID=UPI000BA7A9CC|nr:tRNA 5-methoxyuridine(34)/uridine 5-oxyacetic acid(34) synthase CmoB [Helicobacter sp. 12S02232-10]PAF49543.1 tRNA 5-methoxyuridine(34)/uridine 5-oxyacetic acid(34) synthase CmoB [Helicobacter sp. 12S02232-10]